MAVKKTQAKDKEKEKDKENNKVELPEGYVEISPEQLELLSNAGIQTVMNIGLAESLFIKDMQSRLFYLDENVDEKLLHNITMQIYKINGTDCDIPEENRQPIIIIVNSYGGSVFDGLALMDAIRQSKTPVVGICVGYAMSMAFYIFSVCHMRIAMPNAVFMYHDGSDYIVNTTTKVFDWTNFAPKLYKRLDKMVAENSKLTVEYLEQIAPHDTYWFADEMYEKGIVDNIIGRDISMETIFDFMSDAMPCENEHKCNCNCKDK